MEDKKNIHLSRSILDMKFMKKSKERVMKEQEAIESQNMYSKEITTEMKKSGNLLFIETSIYNCKDLIEGRLSFGGMNPEIEKLMKNDVAKRDKIINPKNEMEISDVQMAKEYSSLVNTVNKKIQKKGKRKFIKPDNDIL